MSPSHSIYLVSLFIWLHAHLLFSRFLFFSCCLIEICFSFDLKSVSSLQCGPVCLPFLLRCIHGPHGVWAEAFVAFHSQTTSSLSGCGFSLQNKVSGVFLEFLTFYLDGFQAGAPVPLPQGQPRHRSSLRNVFLFA